MTIIILLNWNGADDTLACLKSLEKAEGDFRVLIADNGSNDNSVERLSSFVSSSSLIAELLPLGENYGFAKGNNKAIMYARKYQPDWYFLLNNDTEVEPDFLTKLLSFDDAHNHRFSVLTPRINYFAEKSKIWLCGGKLTFGSRKKNYHDAFTNSLPDEEFLPVTFVSGCALMARRDTLNEDGCLLSDNFFFGEEDYEFSLRMRKQHMQMACVFGSVVYHKVGSSHKRMDKRASFGRIYSYYLGRLICARQYYSKLSFNLIRMLSIPGCYKYFRLSLGCRSVARKQLCRLMNECKIKESVTQEDLLA